MKKRFIIYQYCENAEPQYTLIAVCLSKKEAISIYEEILPSFIKKDLSMDDCIGIIKAELDEDMVAGLNQAMEDLQDPDNQSLAGFLLNTLFNECYDWIEEIRNDCAS